VKIITLHVEDDLCELLRQHLDFRTFLGKAMGGVLTVADELALNVVKAIANGNGIITLRRRPSEPDLPKKRKRKARRR